MYTHDIICAFVCICVYYTHINAGSNSDSAVGYFGEISSTIRRPRQTRPGTRLPKVSSRFKPAPRVQAAIQSTVDDKKLEHGCRGPFKGPFRGYRAI